MEKVVIPLPPVKVQKEIADALDELATMTNELIEELQAEIEARKKQYEYYSDTLLTFNKTE